MYKLFLLLFWFIFSCCSDNNISYRLDLNNISSIKGRWIITNTKLITENSDENILLLNIGDIKEFNCKMKALTDISKSGIIVHLSNGKKIYFEISINPTVNSLYIWDMKNFINLGNYGLILKPDTDYKIKIVDCGLRVIFYFDDEVIFKYTNIAKINNISIRSVNGKLTYFDIYYKAKKR